LLEEKLIEGLNKEPSMQDVTLLVKGLSGYYLKMPYLEDLLTQIINEQADQFTV